MANLATDLNKTLTPVKFPEQKTKTAESIEIKSRLAKILEVIIANHNKWGLAQKRGISLCKSIELIKTKAIESRKNSNDTTAPQYYPDDLQIYSDKLAVILRIFQDICTSTKQSKSQLLALKNLNKTEKEILYRTWKFDNFCNFIETVDSIYKNEVEIKKIITREICHSAKRSDLIMHKSLWEYPPFANDDLNIMFIFLQLEIKQN